MGLLDFLFGKPQPHNSGRVEDMDDYTRNLPDDHWTVDHVPDEDRDDDWEEAQDKDFGDDWGEY